LYIGKVNIITRFMRFSGHETFSCRANWLNKGVKLCMLSSTQTIDFTTSEAFLNLGVGKNMSMSIRFWLEAFGLIRADEGGESLQDRLDSEVTQLFYGDENDSVFDPYLEDPITIWYLHYKLVTTKYAGIYYFFFCHFLPKKATDAFTEDELLNSLRSYLRKNELSVPSDNTLMSDFAVFIDMYSVKKNVKHDLDEVASNILQPLEILIRPDINRIKNSTFLVNRSVTDRIPLELLAYLLSSELGKGASKSMDFLLEEYGRPFLFNRNSFHRKVEHLVDNYPTHFVLATSRRTGIAELQVLDLFKLVKE
jgi:hypothetical protein